MIYIPMPFIYYVVIGLKGINKSGNIIVRKVVAYESDGRTTENIT